MLKQFCKSHYSQDSEMLLVTRASRLVLLSSYKDSLRWKFRDNISLFGKDCLSIPVYCRFNLDWLLCFRRIEETISLRQLSFWGIDFCAPTLFIVRNTITFNFKIWSHMSKDEAFSFCKHLTILMLYIQCIVCRIVDVESQIIQWKGGKLFLLFIWSMLKKVRKKTTNA